MKRKLLNLGLSVGLAALLGSCSADTPDGGFENTPIEPSERMVDFLETQKETDMEMFSKLFHEFLERRSEGSEEQNFAYSPLSFSSVFSILANGATGETLDEMMRVVGDGKYNVAALNSYFEDMMSNFPHLDNTVKLNIANSLWVSEESDYELAESFTAQVNDNYNTEVFTCQFDEQLYKRINTWIHNNTSGLITDFYKPGTRLDPPIIVANALYFKAPWTWAFDKTATKKNTFKTYAGQTIEVDMMQKTLKPGEDILYAENDYAEMVEFPLGKKENRSFSLYAILPKAKVDFADFIAAFGVRELSALQVGCEPRSNLTVKLPKFKVSSSCEDFTSVLSRDFGVQRPFSEYDAQFNKLFTHNKYVYYISDIKQNVEFMVDEYGAEGGAATTVGISGGIKENSVVFNRPFLFIVMENATETILFEGVVLKP